MDDSIRRPKEARAPKRARAARECGAGAATRSKDASDVRLLLVVGDVAGDNPWRVCVSENQRLCPIIAKTSVHANDAQREGTQRSRMSCATNPSA